MSNSVNTNLGGATNNTLGEGPNLFYTMSPGYSFFAPTALANYAPSSGVATFDPNAFASLSNSFINTGANALASITNLGALEFSSTSNLFQTWGNSINSLGQQSAAVATQIANKSATACSGFFSCLF